VSLSSNLVTTIVIYPLSYLFTPCMNRFNKTYVILWKSDCIVSGTSVAISIASSMLRLLTSRYAISRICITHSLTSTDSIWGLNLFSEI